MDRRSVWKICQWSHFFDLDPNLPSQEFPKRYRINGAIYVAMRFKTYREEFLFARHWYLMHISWTEFASIDIDTKLDFILAETLLEGTVSNKILSQRTLTVVYRSD